MHIEEKMDLVEMDLAEILSSMREAEPFTLLYNKDFNRNQTLHNDEGDK